MPGHWLEPEVQWEMAMVSGWQWAAGPELALRGPRGPTPCSVPFGCGRGLCLVSSPVGLGCAAWAWQREGSCVPLSKGRASVVSGGWGCSSWIVPTSWSPSPPLPTEQALCGPPLGWQSRAGVGASREPCPAVSRLLEWAHPSTRIMFLKFPFPKVSQSWWVCLKLFFSNLRKDRIWLFPFLFYFSQWELKRFRAKYFSQITRRKELLQGFSEKCHVLTFPGMAQWNGL